MRHAPLPPLLAGAVFLVPLAAYLWSMPPDVVFEDAGAFVSACYTRGVPHPPGYPLYTLLCWPFAHLGEALPVSPAKGVAILSALSNAAASVVLCWILLQLLGSRAAAAALAVTYALGLKSWSQSIIPEVYTLHALLFFLAFALVLRHQQSGRLAHIAAAAFVSGLALSNHWPLFVFAAPALAMLMARRPGLLRRALSPRVLPACLALAALGLLPYAHMLSPPEGAFVFSDGLGEPGGFLDYVSRRIYLDRIGRIEIEDRLRHSLHGIPMLLEEHSPAVALLALPGVWLAARSRDRWLVAAMLWLSLSTLVLLKLVSGNFWVNGAERHGFAVYHLVSYGMWLYFAGVALLWALARIRPPAAAALVAGLLPLASFAMHAGENRRSDDTLALRMAELFWREVPEGAHLDMLGDLTFPATYLRVTRGVRPDVRVVRLKELLGRPVKDAHLGPDDLRDLAGTGKRIVLARRLAGDYRVRYRGLHSELAFGEGPSEVRLSDDAIRFFSGLVRDHGEERNQWNLAFTETQVRDLAWKLHVLRHRSPHLFTERLRALYWETQSTFPGKLGVFLARAIDGADPLPPEGILALASALRTGEPGISAGDQALLLHIEGTAHVAAGSLLAAENLFRKSLWLDPSPRSNLAAIDLLQMQALAGEWEKYSRFRRRYRSLGAVASLEESDRDCAAALGSACAPGGAQAAD